MVMPTEERSWLLDRLHKQLKKEADEAKKARRGKRGKR